MEKLKQLVKEKQFYTIFISVFAVGFFIHGSCIFTNYHFQDSIRHMYGGGNDFLFSLGRFSLYAFRNVELLLMNSTINARGYIAIIAFILISLMCYIIAQGLKIKRTGSLILLSVLFTTSPYVASLFGYSYTAVPYLFGNVICLVIALVIARVKALKSYFKIAPIAILLLSFSLGIYQATVCMFVSFLLLLAIRTSLEEDNESWKSFITRCIRYLIPFLGGFILYFLISKVVLTITGNSLTSYQGIDKVSSLSVADIFSRLLSCYREFFVPQLARSTFLFSKQIYICYLLVLLILLFYILTILLRTMKNKKYRKAIQLTILFSLVPLATKSIFILVDNRQSEIHSLMILADIMVYVFLIFMIENVTMFNNCSLSRINKCISGVGIGVLLYTSVYFGYIDNVCYTQTAFCHDQVVGYFNRLITRIQQTEGYSTDLKVLYINPNEKRADSTFNESFGYIHNVLPYHRCTINMHSWKSFMSYRCGYEPVELEEEEAQKYLHLPEIQEMSCYPDYDSIRVVEGVVIVKFAE